jgi:4a-hydroxytetrahydrobiopterin dehydratase
MTQSLADRACVPCKGGVPPLTREQFAPLLAQLDGWAVEDDRKLVKRYRFKDFREALEFVNRAGGIAEAERHHPDLHLAWGRVGAEIWTHKIDGLTESDFVLAAKLDRARAGMEV